MKIVTDLSQFRKEDYPRLVVALGNFDGVHLGHLEIIKTVRERAAQIGGTASIFTFKEHPQRVLHRREDPPILSSLIHKLFLLKQAGVELCFLVDFTISLSEKNPDAFVRDIFVERLGAREVCLGYNARFGHNRLGDSNLMRQLADQYGFRFFEAPPFQVKGQNVSSSAIRFLVRDGKLEEAGALLGRPYSFFGTVISGSGRGRGLGFPTLNLDPHSEVMPPEGVYATWVRIMECRLMERTKGWASFEARLIGARLRALMNYGRRPTFAGDNAAIPEVHILDFDGELNGKTVEVTIGARLRPEVAFRDPEALRKQIREDIEAGQRWFNEAQTYGTK
ncbi:MAG: riboflavin biosynthesis protein RibF [Candidatus Omnitrophica bacterium]|nr:riboflavin biosynthesis protein RibF [Candidatus Omnitrophota bacterium]